MAVIFLVILGDILLSESNNGIFSQVNKLKISVLKFYCKRTNKKAPKPPTPWHLLRYVRQLLGIVGARVPQERHAGQRTLQEFSRRLFRTTAEGMASYRLHLIDAALRHSEVSRLAQGHAAHGGQLGIEPKWCDYIFLSLFVTVHQWIENGTKELIADECSRRACLSWAPVRMIFSIDLRYSPSACFSQFV